MSTATAAPYVWQLMQAFYSAFPQYKSRDFGLFTESYGGHYGPEFSAYFEGQNAAIAQGSVAGETIKLVALGVNNGWFDAGIQYQSYPDFAYNNTHKRLITSAQYSSLMKAYDTQCAPAMAKCTGPAGNTAAACNAASEACANAVQTPIEQANDFDVYDIRAPSDDPNPPDTYVKFLQSPAVMKAIGARQTYQECPDAPYDKMQTSGDDARSFLDPLSKVVQSGIQVLLWAGDADWICNWVGGLAVANAVTYSGTSQFASKPVAPYTVNGKSYGEFKNVGNLSWLKVFDAGHEV